MRGRGERRCRRGAGLVAGAHIDGGRAAAADARASGRENADILLDGVAVGNDNRIRHATAVVYMEAGGGEWGVAVRRAVAVLACKGTAVLEVLVRVVRKAAVRVGDGTW